MFLKKVRRDLYVHHLLQHSRDKTNDRVRFSIDTSTPTPQVSEAHGYSPWLSSTSEQAREIEFSAGPVKLTKAFVRTVRRRNNAGRQSSGTARVVRSSCRGRVTTRPTAEPTRSLWR